MDPLANITTPNETFINIPRASHWTFLLGLKTVIMISSIGLNVGVSLYHMTSVKVTSFSVYLIALFIANTLYCAVVTPLEIASELFGEWWMGRSACIAYNYFETVVSLGPVMFHALIAINRIWAVKYPMSYKQHHTKKTAGWMCLGSLCYAHIVILPGYVMDSLYYHLPEKQYGCVINRAILKSWGQAENLLGRFIPLLLIMVIYVYVSVTLWHRKHRRLDVAATGSHAMHPPRTVRSGNTADNAASVVPTSADPLASPKREIKASFVLTLTVISITVFWLPADALFLGFMFFDTVITETAFSAVMLMYSFQSVFDPLMLVFSLKRLVKKQ